jgi:hypothetical protein
MSKRKFPTFLLFVYILYSLLFILFPPLAKAVCPVCTIAVGAGLGISRALGIDDAVTSVWIGGLILSMSFWFIDWLKRKYPHSQISNNQLLIIIFMYLLTLIPLYFGKYIGRPYNSIFGIDKILFGTFWGSLTFTFGKWVDGKIRLIKGKQLFVYQRVIFPVLSLIITSVILHFVVGSW